MHYKTIVLELLQHQYPALHEQLRASRTLLATMNDSAAALRAAHFTWMAELRQANPGLDPSRISGEALEMAIQDLRDSLDGLPSASEPNGAETETLSLDAAMNFLRRHTPRA
jgi:hypothetical protein